MLASGCAEFAGTLEPDLANIVLVHCPDFTEARVDNVACQAFRAALQKALGPSALTGKSDDPIIEALLELGYEEPIPRQQDPNGSKQRAHKLAVSALLEIIPSLTEAAEGRHWPQKRLFTLKPSEKPDYVPRHSALEQVTIGDLCEILHFVRLENHQEQLAEIRKALEETMKEPAVQRHLEELARREALAEVDRINGATGRHSSRKSSAEVRGEGRKARS